MTKLHIVNGLNRGESYDIKRDIITVGRSPDNDIPLKDNFVSRQHLKIRREGNRYFIEDLKSSNGTFVNGRQIRPGVELEIGEGLPIAIGLSVICLGEVWSEDVAAFLESIGVSKDVSKRFGISIKDRRLSGRKNMELLYKVSNTLMESSDLREISQKILGYTFQILKRIDRGAILLIDSKTGKVSKAIARLRKGSADESKKFSRTVVDRVIREGKAVVIPDAGAEDEVDLSKTVRLLKIGSVMCVPLISRSRVFGAIYVDSLNRPHGFRKEDLSLLTAFATQAALAMENALLYSFLEGRGAERRRNSDTDPSP